MTSSSDSDSDRFDPVQAQKDARTKAKPKSAAPHYMRCEWYRGTRRCLFAEGHGGDHEFEQERQNT